MRLEARDPVRHAVAGLLAWLHLRRPAAAVRRRWRRSLQLRVVTATVLLGMAVVIALGQFLYTRLADGLVDSRVEAADGEMSRLRGEAQTQFDQAGITDADSAAAAIASVVGGLQGPIDNTDRSILIRKAPGDDTTGPIGSRAGGIREADIPAELRTAVLDDPGRLQHKLVELGGGVQGASTEKAIVVGSVVTLDVVGQYELYVVFPLDREQELLAVVRRTFIVGGLVLVGLVAAVAAVVTQWVVAPVRHAARTAEELASGRLDRRMRVRGEDDLARLARAFNEMAGSLERQINRLEELSRLQRRFVSDVSHELRTPLTTIRLADEVMHEARASFDPVVARSAELLHAQLDRFEALLADLLEISRFDAGAAELEADPVDVRELVARVAEGLRPLSEAKGSELRLHLPAAACPAEVDVRRVERIVRNLVGNAVEHGEGRPIDVTVAADADAVAVAVRDHGVGLRESELPQVFSRFWRADPARARATGGTGLGLAIALEDAHLHAGALQAWGRPGQGANFLLTLPRRSNVLLTHSPLPLDPREDLAPDDGSAARSPAGPLPTDRLPAGPLPGDRRPAVVDEPLGVAGVPASHGGAARGGDGDA